MTQSMTLRWALKRTLKWSLEWTMALSGLGLLYRKSDLFRDGYRILTYHKISGSPEDSYTVRTDHFRAHMSYLADHYNVIGLAELAGGLIHGPLPPPGSIAVTFDDGYRDAHTIACETLARHGISATFFVITGVLDGELNRTGGPYLTWNDVRDMAAAGFTIGSHTVSHSSLGELAVTDVRRELEASRARISEEIGTPPLTLSYPYGTLRDFSPAVAQVARETGYECAVTAIHGLNHTRTDPLLLRRTTMTAGDGMRTFRMILKGHLDPWHLIDKWGYRFQRPSTHGGYG